ncbi:MAG: CHAT domain-containing protein [Snowella sp.]|nr:CHAT domain-containing protein [Snowella sp.]
MLELTLNFTTADQVTVSFDDETSEAIAFSSPLTEKNQKDLRWYMETYASGHMTEVDDRRAEQIAAQLKEWGKALFNQVFGARDAQRLFNAFQDSREVGRVVTLNAEQPKILALPWELLHDPQGNYLFNENPRISIRRKLKRGGRKPFKVNPKHQLHLLFVISRPDDVGFLDPRTEPKAVLNALAVKGINQVTVEFLRPATFDKLIKRLENTDLPQVDILHFDGHGVFDADGVYFEEAKMVFPEAYTGIKAGENSLVNRKNMGYLVFETEEGKRALIDAEKLGDMLHQQAVSLVFLSACQSGMVGTSEESVDEEALGSIAVRLTKTGIPSIIAMTYSVLIDSTEKLLGEFYENLANGKAIAESLDNARRYLIRNPDRGERQRGQKRITLKLQDWFLPALYQSGQDVPLLINSLPLSSTNIYSPPFLRGAGGDQTLQTGTGGDEEIGENQPLNPSLSSTNPYSSRVQSANIYSPPFQRGAGGDHHNLPKQPEAGFFGRSRELWKIDRWFTQNTRRITLSGFGGQGKTSLAIEAGAWLQTTGMFSRVCFVDYANFQSLDALAVAVATLATVLHHSFLDAEAVIPVLAQIPTLIILDNLEALPETALQPLLTAAKVWSEVEQTRLLLTTRSPEFGHPDYSSTSLKHRFLRLDGLAAQDALDYVQRLMQFPPEPTYGVPARQDLLDLLDLVAFHPLSIKVLVPQLKARPLGELGLALQQAILDSSNLEEKDRSLVASLNLSLARLDERAKALLPRLGVFQGGAFELELLAITELTETDWSVLRAQLVNEGLIELEAVPGVNSPFIKFHPTLAPVLLLKLRSPHTTPSTPTSPTTEEAQLLARHRERYYQLSRYLYHEDQKNPDFARSIVRRELPNLLFAVDHALRLQEDWAVEFVDKLNKFLGNFGLNGTRQSLTERASQRASEVGSNDWFLVHFNTGEQLRQAGQTQKAEAVFQNILEGLGETASYQRCLTLGCLGRCLSRQGRSPEAATLYRQAIAVAQQLESNDSVKRQIGALQADLGDVLGQIGDYGAARTAYEQALAIDEETGDERGQAVTLGQLGTLALMEGNLTEAAQRYQVALRRFQQLGEPETEAAYWHQLGRVYQAAEQWAEADQSYREAARINESQSNLTGAAKTWGQLAHLNELAGNLDSAEAWTRKAIKGFETAGDRFSQSLALSNLAGLLQQFGDRLPEARQAAEDSLAIKQTPDPNTAEIWKNYGILAEITAQQGETATAQNYRRLMRESYLAAPVCRHDLQRFLPLIEAIVDNWQDLEPVLADLVENGWGELAQALARYQAGERNEDQLYQNLGYQQSAILHTVLSRLG